MQRPLPPNRDSAIQPKSSSTEAAGDRKLFRPDPSAIIETLCFETGRLLFALPTSARKTTAFPFLG
jgi:hypothetical protein